jgi:hypothetical protein
MRISFGFLGAGFIAVLYLAGEPAAAFERIQAPGPKPEMMENCPGLVASDRPRIIPAAFRVAQLKFDQVRITYIGHSTFLIQTPAVNILTDPIYSE